MNTAIKIDVGGMDKKYFYAFIKGLSTIKYKEYFEKSKAASGGDSEENMDLQFLYSNLFNEQETSLECKYILIRVIIL